MIPGREVRRMEKAAKALPDPGCLACHGRRGRIVVVDGGPFPEACAACGIRPEFLIVVGSSAPRQDGGAARQEGTP